MTASSVLGKPLDVVRELEGTTGEVVSSDLRAASDLVPFDVCSAIVDGLEDSGRLLPVELHGLRLGIGPMEITWPDGETRVTSRGILMGLPTTWSLLNLYHGWCWTTAVAQVRPRYEVAARICGDDLIGVCPPEVRREYEARLVRTGAELSEGKHFVSPDRGVFLEVLWDFRGPRVHHVDGQFLVNRIVRRTDKRGRKRRVLVPTNIVVLHRMKSITPLTVMPLRGLVVGDEPHGHGADEAPDWWLAGVAETAYCRSYPRKLVHAVARTLRPSLPAKFESVGVPPYLPRSMGGAGLCPPSRRCRVSPKHRKAISCLIWGQSLRDMIQFESVWADSKPGHWRSICVADADTELSGKDVAWRLDHQPGPIDWIPLGDPMEAREALVQRTCRDYQVMLGPDVDGMRFPDLPTMGKLLAQTRNKLLAGWLSVQPTKKPIPELLSQWEKRRSTLKLWVPRHFPDFNEHTSNTRLNEGLVASPDLNFLKTWRQFATASVSRIEPWWVDYVLPPRCFPRPTYASL
jgi:hypothetical protein